MSYRKVGGLHFVRVWRFGFNFYLTKPKPAFKPKRRDTLAAYIFAAVPHSLA
jgi:hypothetical protein